jgi:hypothetical protein
VAFAVACPICGICRYLARALRKIPGVMQLMCCGHSILCGVSVCSKVHVVEYISFQVARCMLQHVLANILHRGIYMQPNCKVRPGQSYESWICQAQNSANWRSENWYAMVWVQFLNCNYAHFCLFVCLSVCLFVSVCVCCCFLNDSLFHFFVPKKNSAINEFKIGIGRIEPTKFNKPDTFEPFDCNLAPF